MGEPIAPSGSPRSACIGAAPASKVGASMWRYTSAAIRVPL